MLKLLTKGKDPIPTFTPTATSLNSEYPFLFKLNQDLRQDLFIYYELEDFSQNAFRIPNTIGNKPIPFKEAVESPLGNRYIRIDVVEFIKIESKHYQPVTIEFPSIKNKFGRVQVVQPEESEYSEWNSPNKNNQENLEKFKGEHFARFCQWLFPSPLEITAKVIGKVKGGLKAGSYSIIFRLGKLPSGDASVENLKLFLKPKSKVRVKSETTKYLIVMIATSMLSQIFVLLLRYFFPKSQRERDLVEGYRMKMERFRIG